MASKRGATHVSAISAALAEAVDEAFYVFTYGVLPDGTAAADHYAEHGWRAGRDPNPWFSTNSYLLENPELRSSEDIPLFHFLQYGSTQGKRAQRSSHAEAYYRRDLVEHDSLSKNEPAHDDGAREYRRRVVAQSLDRAFYLELYRDVADAGIDPIDHFLDDGWREGRDPTAWFSTRQYLEANTDVEAAGVNPFVHYLETGKSEGRKLRLELGFRYDILKGETSLAQRLAMASDFPESKISPIDTLREDLTTARRSDKCRLHLSVSHDNFVTNVGGLQFCLQREAAGFEENGFDHIHLFPARPLLVTDHEHPDPAIGVLINGTLSGYYHAGDVAELFEEEIGSIGTFAKKSFAVHSLLGHNAASIARIVTALRIRDGFFWVHDFASVCAGHNLLRNDVEFCNAPPPESPACNLCLYGERRRLQVADHAMLFDAIRMTVVAPARRTLDLWLHGSSLRRERTIVKPHCTLEPKTITSEPEQSRALRVAFLGLPHGHKGWPVFRDLALAFGDDPRYEFFHLGMFAQPGLPVAFFPVEVSAANPNAMTDAVAAYDIDLAVIWSICPETFCFTAHEALAGGALIVAPPRSGNLSQLVDDTGMGVTLAGERELAAYFSSGEALTLARSVRTVERFDLVYSNLTADLVDASL